MLHCTGGTNHFVLWLADTSFPIGVKDAWRDASSWNQALEDFGRRASEWNLHSFGNILNRKKRLVRRVEGINKELDIGTNRYLHVIGYIMGIEMRDFPIPLPSLEESNKN